MNNRAARLATCPGKSIPRRAGSRSAGLPPVGGALAESPSAAIRVCNRGLDAAEVAQVMAPELSLARSGNDLILSWPVSGYILQQNGNLTNPAGWTDLGGATSSRVTLALPASGNKFYRLKKQ